jgi:hypothetical protein
MAIGAVLLSGGPPPDRSIGCSRVGGHRARGDRGRAAAAGSLAAAIANLNALAVAAQQGLSSQADDT